MRIEFVFPRKYAPEKHYTMQIDGGPILHTKSRNCNTFFDTLRDFERITFWDSKEDPKQFKGHYLTTRKHNRDHIEVVGMWSVGWDYKYTNIFGFDGTNPGYCTFPGVHLIPLVKKLYRDAFPNGSCVLGSGLLVKNYEELYTDLLRKEHPAELDLLLKGMQEETK